MSVMTMMSVMSVMSVTFAMSVITMMSVMSASGATVSDELCGCLRPVELMKVLGPVWSRMRPAPNGSTLPLHNSAEV